MASTSITSRSSSNASQRTLLVVLLLGLFSIQFSSKTVRRQKEVLVQESPTASDATIGRRTMLKRNGTDIVRDPAVTNNSRVISTESKPTLRASSPIPNATIFTTVNTSIPVILSAVDPPSSAPTKAPVDRLSVFSICGIPNRMLTDSQCQKHLDTNTTPEATTPLSPKSHNHSNVPSLILDLDCYRLQRAMKQNNVTRGVNFIATANTKYEDFLPSYAFFALSQNKNSVVEFIVEDHTRFIQTHARALAWLLDNMGENPEDLAFNVTTTTATTRQDDGDGDFLLTLSNNRLCVRSFETDPTRLKQAVKNTWRYLETPVLRNHTEYTYIGDIDVYLYESVVHPYRLEQMSKFNIPYSNIVRLTDFSDGEGRLTGLMLIKTREFFTPSLVQAQQTVNVTGNDERVLFRIVKAAGLGLPPTTVGLDEYSLLDYSNNYNNETIDLVTYRPVHGLHLSLNRGPYLRMCQPEWTEYRVRWVWCAVMKTPRLAEFWCHDPAGRALMQEFIERVQEQIKGKFQKIDGNCTPAAK